MKNLAPKVFRQRLLIEGFFSIKVTRKTVEQYFKEITKNLELRTYGKPIIFSPAGIGKKENQGYDAFVPLIDSGISIYIWGNAKFFSGIIYTCKGFDEKTAVETTKNFFKIKEIAFSSF
ncbi:MAG: S-adenosylmethionine decarboxylase [Candidatus Aenigmatarchaeota archaeon]